MQMVELPQDYNLISDASLSKALPERSKKLKGIISGQNAKSKKQAKMQKIEEKSKNGQLVGKNKSESDHSSTGIDFLPQNL